MTIYGLIVCYLLISGLGMLVGYKLEEYSFSYFIELIELVAFVGIIYSINNYYFQKINLEPPKFVRLDSTAYRAILIGILLVFIIQFPYRIYAVIKSGQVEYLYLDFNFKIFKRALWAGITEELVFRGTFLNFYKQKNKQYSGLIISSLLFGLLHISNSIVGVDVSVFYIFQITIAGILFGLIYLNFGLITSITAHVVGNMILQAFVHGTRYGIYYYIGIVVTLCIWLLIRERQSQEKQAHENTKANNI